MALCHAEFRDRLLKSEIFVSRVVFTSRCSDHGSICVFNDASMLCISW